MDLNMEDNTIIIKKYSNRRLYDTHSRRYITLNTVAQMIREGKEIRVIDAKTGEDLTRTVMLQIICENKPHQEALPISFLRQIIQASSETVRYSIREFLNSAASVQKELHNQVSELQNQFVNFQHQITSSIKQHSPDVLNSLSSFISPFINLVSPGKDGSVRVETDSSGQGISLSGRGRTEEERPEPDSRGRGGGKQARGTASSPASEREAKVAKTEAETENSSESGKIDNLRSEISQLKSQIEYLQKQLEELARGKKKDN